MVITDTAKFTVSLLIINSLTGITLGQHSAFVNVIQDASKKSDPASANWIKGYLPSVKYHFYNATFTGLKESTVSNVQINQEKRIILFNIESPQIEMLATYKLRGKIGGFSISGEGPVHVLIDDYLIAFECDYAKNNGHVQITNYIIEATPRSKTLLDFQNLSAGDEEKSREFQKYLNDNLVRLEMELRSPALNTFMDILIDNVNKILESMPADEILA